MTVIDQAQNIVDLFKKALTEGKLEEGDIVIVQTFDIGLGHCTIPAVVRYYDEEHDAYEVNAYADDGHQCAFGEWHNGMPGVIHWLTVSRSEMIGPIAKVKMEK